MALSTSGLNFAGQKAVELLARIIPHISFPNFSGTKFLNYELKDIRVS